MIRFVFATAVCFAALSSSPGFGQKKGDPFGLGETAKPSRLVLKVYRVTDLFTPRPDYPYRPGLPTTDALAPKPNSNPTTGGGVGGGSQGGGTGIFQVPDVPRMAQFGGGMNGGLGGGFGGGVMGTEGPSADESLRFTREQLREAIIYTVQPDTWEENGGDAVCTALGGMFLIKQTEESHNEIEKLLSDIRTEGGGSHTVNVEATWLELNTDDLEKLVPEQKNGGLATVDPAELKQMAAKNPSHKGRVSCYNDQTVHIASGNRRTVVVNAVPSVGFGSVGYTPQVAIPNVGLLLQVRPTVDPDRKSAVLNVTSTLTEWQNPGKPMTLKTDIADASKDGLSTKGGTAEMTVDRINLNTQHLGTTVRLPVGQPVLIGGLSNIHADGDADRQLHLIVKISVNEPTREK